MWQNFVVEEMAIVNETAQNLKAGSGCSQMP